MFICLENSDGAAEIYVIDEPSDQARAAARMRELGIGWTEVWAGDFDEFDICEDAIKTTSRFFSEGR